MQLLSRQPQVGETINDQIAKHITIANDGIQVQTTPLLTNQYGTLSKAVFVAIIEETVRYEMRKLKKLEVMIESLNIIYIKTVQIESEIHVHYEMLDVGRNFVTNASLDDETSLKITTRCSIYFFNHSTGVSVFSFIFIAEDNLNKSLRPILSRANTIVSTTSNPSVTLTVIPKIG